MRNSFALNRLAAAAAVLLAPAAVACGLNPVKLDPRALAAGGIRTVRVKSVRIAPQVAGYGIVLGPGALMRSVARLVAARSAVAAANAKVVLARQQARRAAYLYHARHNIAQAALQRARSAFAVAEAQRATAAAILVEARTRMLTRWGPGLATAALSGSAPLPAIERGAAVLVEISLPLGETVGHPPAIASARSPDGVEVSLRFLTRAPHTAAGVAGVSLLYLMHARASVPIGTPLSVSLDASAARTGVQVPRSAVLWHHGEPWVLRETAPRSFTPVPIPGAFSADDGYFVPEHAGVPLKAGERIIAAGAGLVYSAAVQSPPAGKAAPGRLASDGGA